LLLTRTEIEKGMLPLPSTFSARGNGYLLACSSFSLSPPESRESVNKRHLTIFWLPEVVCIPRSDIRLVFQVAVVSVVFVVFEFCDFVAEV
jgi:hypothetical protein